MDDFTTSNFFTPCNEFKFVIFDICFSWFCIFCCFDITPEFEEEEAEGDWEEDCVDVWDNFKRGKIGEAGAIEKNK